MATSSASPTVVLIPGAWNKPSVFCPLQLALARRKLATETLGHPSNGAEPPYKTLQDDISHLHEFLKSLVHTGKYLIVVAHSYGGVVASGAVAGLSKAERKRQGLLGGVSMILYMTAFVIPKGLSLKDTMGGKFPDFMNVQGNYIHLTEGPDIGFDDVPPEEQIKYADSFTHICRGAFEVAATYEPWHEIPSAYIFCENDRALPLPLQEKMAQQLNTEFHYRLNSSHMPFISMPEKVADIIEELSVKI